MKKFKSVALDWDTLMQRFDCRQTRRLMGEKHQPHQEMLCTVHLNVLHHEDRYVVRRNGT